MPHLRAPSQCSAQAVALQILGTPGVELVKERKKGEGFLEGAKRESER